MRDWRTFYQVWIKRSDAQGGEWFRQHSTSNYSDAWIYARDNVSPNPRVFSRIEVRDYWGDSGTGVAVWDSNWPLIRPNHSPP